MNRSKEILNKITEALEGLRLKTITISGSSYPILSWVEGDYDCAMIIEPRKNAFAVSVYGGYNLDKTSLHELDESSDWYSRKTGFKDLEAAKSFFDEHVKIIKAKGSLAVTGFPKGWGDFFGMTDEVLAGLSSKSNG
jgi:hypothetical protein